LKLKSKFKHTIVKFKKTLNTTSSCVEVCLTRYSLLEKNEC